MKKVLDSYVPRHLRLGVCCSIPKIECFHDVVELVPVVDEDGVVVETHKVLKQVPVSDVMSKYKVDNFRLSSMVRNGVPLKLVNINHTSTFTISELERISQNIDAADNFVKQVSAEREEKQSWFKSFDDKDVKDLEGKNV